jgi:hypothetical protein
MVNTATGQVLNTISCASCPFASHTFTPFRLLSIPLPSTANVVFKCNVVRRVDAYNCPWVLDKPRKGRNMEARFASDENRVDSDQFIIEQYVFTMPRLANSGSLNLKVQNLCGIPSDRLTLCLAEEAFVKACEGPVLVQVQTSVTPLVGTEGPCAQFIREGGTNGSTGPASAPVQLVAFESTLCPRPLEIREEGRSKTAVEQLQNEEEGTHQGLSEDTRMLEKLIDLYGNGSEGRVYDTDMLPIAQAISRSLWPRSEDDFRIGLRVDAVDHQGRWYPGSVVEVKGHRKSRGTTKLPTIRVHFDNFSSKWDEKYTIEHFIQGRVKPLYSQASLRKNPTEFVVHHRYTNRSSKVSNLFGQSFIVQCHSEWSTARAAAQILCQASRYLAAPPEQDDDSELRSVKVQRLYNRSQTVISDLIDKLIDFDREYVHRALGVVPQANSERFRNPDFDSAPVSASLVKRLDGLLHRLPFELRVCTDFAPLGDENNDVTFPFSLERTIGNYMNARLIVVLRWREPPSDSSPTGETNIYLNAPVMYMPPVVSVDKRSAEILSNPNHEVEGEGSTEATSGGMQLRACLTEFCRVRELSPSENWKCPRCETCPLGKRTLKLWRLPDILTFQIKRYKESTDWRQKITTRVNFPLSGLDMSEWCHQESPLTQHNSDGSCVYDLIGVVNHEGSFSEGRYTANCRASWCSREGRESIAHHFNDAVGKRLDALDLDLSENDASQQTNPNTNATEESAEPLWLQFDDGSVKPIPPHSVVSEMAYILFYRRRRLTPSNLAKYSSL